jgi:hypothetical protein
MMEALASAGQREKIQRQQRKRRDPEAPDKRNEWSWNSREHNRWRSS